MSHCRRHISIRRLNSHFSPRHFRLMPAIISLSSITLLSLTPLMMTPFRFRFSFAALMLMLSLSLRFHFIFHFSPH
jgi:hypothetical protein